MPQHRKVEKTLTKEAMHHHRKANEKQMEILKAHPDLATKTRIGSLTMDSKKEQNSAGLDKCTEEEFNEFKSLNLEYKKKFGFPFIFAVKDKSKLEILSNFRKRISYDINIEFGEAKKQVKKIASLRLNEIDKKLGARIIKDGTNRQCNAHSKDKDIATPSTLNLLVIIIFYT